MEKMRVYSLRYYLVQLQSNVEVIVNSQPAEGLCQGAKAVLARLVTIPCGSVEENRYGYLSFLNAVK
jgi:hypothetical protein